MEKKTERRDLDRSRTKAQKSALKAWDDVIQKFGDDAPDGPLYRAFTADVGMAAYWQDRALRAEKRALKLRPIPVASYASRG